MDTGALVSAFAFGGVPAKAVIKAFTGDRDLLEIADLPFELRIVTARAFVED